jgi:hypothetical protein
LAALDNRRATVVETGPRDGADRLALGIPCACSIVRPMKLTPLCAA